MKLKSIRRWNTYVRVWCRRLEPLHRKSLVTTFMALFATASIVVMALSIKDMANHNHTAIEIDHIEPIELLKPNQNRLNPRNNDTGTRNHHTDSTAYRQGEKQQHTTTTKN